MADPNAPNVDDQTTADPNNYDHPRDDHREAHHHANQMADPNAPNVDDQTTADQRHCAMAALSQAYLRRIWATRTSLASSGAYRTTVGRLTHLNVAYP